ncbi:hypothetical protein Tco_0149722 [Tanacetum coccineum]
MVDSRHTYASSSGSVGYKTRMEYDLPPQNGQMSVVSVLSDVGGYASELCYHLRALRVHHLRLFGEESGLFGQKLCKKRTEKDCNSKLRKGLKEARSIDAEKLCDKRRKPQLILSWRSVHLLRVLKVSPWKGLYGFWYSNLKKGCHWSEPDVQVPLDEIEIV